jgi:hypothetical protein
VPCSLNSSCQKLLVKVGSRSETIGIRALSLVGVVGKYFLFLQIFFSEKKKEGRDIPKIFSIFLCKIFRNRL